MAIIPSKVLDELNTSLPEKESAILTEIETKLNKVNLLNEQGIEAVPFLEELEDGRQAAIIAVKRD